MPDRFTPLLFPEMEAEAPVVEARLPDAEARAEALDVRGSFAVEAPAGSGKTGLLIQRYMKLLGDEEVSEPEQVLAITFTNKAAGEMRDRVLAQLEKARSGAEAGSEFERLSRELAGRALARDRMLGWRLLEQPFRLNLRTIDSVCAQVARSLPVLSGSAGGLRPTEDAGPLFREAARRTLLLLADGGGDPTLAAALRDLLLHRDANLRDCEELIAEMLSVRDQWGMLIPLDREMLTDEVMDREVLPKLERTLQEAVCAELSALAEEIPGDVLEDLAPLADEMSFAELHDPGVAPLAACRGRKSAPGNLADDLKQWRALVHLLVKPSAPRDWRKSFARNTMKFVMEKRHQEQMKELIGRVAHRPELVDALCRIEALPEPVYPADQWAMAKSLFRVLRRALVELQLVFAERGACDFTEVSLLARSALRGGAGPEEVASAVGAGPGAGLQHLLVDEMQDTSTGQYELIHMLTQGWDGVSQTVFLVGDPRQSIYLFRQARVEHFVHTLKTERLGELRVKRLRLTANFRSQRRLVEQFNEDFARVFEAGAGDAGTALPYRAADPVLPEARDAEGRRWHPRPVTVPKPGEAVEVKAPMLRLRQARRNAQTVRAVARRWLGKPLPEGRTEPWRIGVLVRNRRHLAEVVSEFQNEDGPGGRIPYKATEIEPLNERQEVLDLVALTRALLHPADRVAGLALLRAPWCGVSLKDLLVLTGSDEDGFDHYSVMRLMEERGELLSADGGARMRRLWTVLDAAQRQRGRMSTAELVERAWRSLGGDAALRDDELTNARRYFELLDEMEARSGAPPDHRELERRLQRLYAEPQTFAPGTPYVELLTMHRAKGLEWDVVLMPALERWPGRTRARLLTWAELSSDGTEGSAMMLAPIAARGEEVDGLTRWLKRKYLEQEAAERKRLFYVAATRAREELHLFASPDRRDGAVKPAPGSLLKAAWEAAEPYFAPSVSLETMAVAHLHVDPGVVELAAGAEVVQMPARNGAARNSLLGDAGGFAPEATAKALYSEPARPEIVRLPESVRPEERFAEARAERVRYRIGGIEEAAGAERMEFARPEGSLAARSLGNAVHALLELIAGRTSRGEDLKDIAREIAGWRPRVAALLRADGIAPGEVERLTRETMTALGNAVRDPDGAWVLSVHPGAGSEYALVGMRDGDDRPYSIRVDRLFMAGPEPRAPGEGCLWVVDYKTGAHSGAGVEEFLAEQRRVYAPQLERYGRLLAAERRVELERVRVGLYYPALPRLVWWVPAEGRPR